MFDDVRSNLGITLMKEKDFYSGIVGSFDGLVDKFGSTMRHFPELVNKKIVDFNPLLPLGQYFTFFDYFHDEYAELLENNDVLNTVYLRLNEQLGEETFVGDWYTVEQSGIDNFAKVTGDQQWIHIDPERAKQQSPFKTTIAHGFLTLALIPLLTESVDPKKNIFPEAKMVVNYGLNRVIFPFPVKVGKRIRARARIIKLVPMKRGLEVVREITIEIENSTRSACIAETVLRLYF